MSSVKTWIKLCAVMLTLGASSPAADKTLIDYFLPTPIRGQLTTDVWGAPNVLPRDRKSTRLNSSHLGISYAVFCLKKKKKNRQRRRRHTTSRDPTERTAHCRFV